MGTVGHFVRINSNLRTLIHSEFSIPWSMPAEVHASSFRAKGVALATVRSTIVFPRICLTKLSMLDLQVSNWSFNFIVGLITPPLLEKTGYGTFVFFGGENKIFLSPFLKCFSSVTALLTHYTFFPQCLVFSLLSGVWSYYIIPETRGRTLEQIDGVS